MKENGRVLTPSNSYPETIEVPLAVIIGGAIVITVPAIETNEIMGATRVTVITSFSVSVIAGKV